MCRRLMNVRFDERQFNDVSCHERLERETDVIGCALISVPASDRSTRFGDLC